MNEVPSDQADADAKGRSHARDHEHPVHRINKNPYWTFGLSVAAYVSAFAAVVAAFVGVYALLEANGSSTTQTAEIEAREFIAALRDLGLKDRHSNATSGQSGSQGPSEIGQQASPAAQSDTNLQPKPSGAGQVGTTSQPPATSPSSELTGIGGPQTAPSVPPSRPTPPRSIGSPTISAAQPPHSTKQLQASLQPPPAAPRQRKTTDAQEARLPTERPSLDKWRAIPLDSEAAKKIPVFVFRSSSSQDLNSIAKAVEDALDAANFDRVRDEGDAVLLIKLSDAKVSPERFSDEVSPNGLEKVIWTTGAHAVVQFVHQTPIMDKYFSVSEDGDAEDGRTQSILRAGAKICAAAFKLCSEN